MRRAFKYRIYPNIEQSVLINKTIGSARLMYNLLLDDYKYQLDYKVDKPSLKEVSFFKPKFPFLKEVDSLALANAKQNLRFALTNFFNSKKGKHKGKKVQFPKFHTKNKSKWRYTTNNQSNSIRLDVEKELIKLPKVGYVEINLHRPLQGNITSCSVERSRDNKYYVSLCVELEDSIPSYNEIPLSEKKIIGLDMSLSNFIVDSEDISSNDTKTTYIRQYRMNEKKLKKLNKRLSRKVKGSKNREKARRCLASHHTYIANCRKDFCHKEALHYARGDMML